MNNQNTKKNKCYLSLRLSKRNTKTLSFLLSLAILNLTISCSYYTVRHVPTTEETVSKTVKEFNQSEKYVILHLGEWSWHLENTIVNDDNQTMSGEISEVGESHKSLKPRQSKRVHRYNPSKTQPLNEVHFHLKNINNFENTQTVSIPLSDIESISVNDKNTGRAIANVFLGTIGTAFAVLLIVAALKSSCPFVYIKNGEEYAFVGELYPGTITPNMQKDDYLPLPNFESENDEYTVKISNYLKEVQYTDQVQLVLVNHDKDIEVLMDSNGSLQTFRNLVPPKESIQDNGIKNLSLALKKDNQFYAFDTPIKTNNSTRNMVFKFEKQKESKEAKLYLTAKNSVWLDYAFGKFNEQFGSYYNTFQKKQQEVSGDSIAKWKMNQHIPLSVYKNTKTGWELIERIGTVGPMAMRDIVVPINMDDVDGDNIEIKLETGFMFWEVDYVAIDFSENLDLKPEYITPSKALDQKGNDVTKLLIEADKNYFVQPHIGDEVIVNFPASKNQECLEQSVFIKNRGYYNYIRDYKGIPDFEKLKTFRQPNTFTKFSEEAYLNFVNYNPNNLAYNE